MSCPPFRYTWLFHAYYVGICRHLYFVGPGAARANLPHDFLLRTCCLLLMLPFSIFVISGVFKFVRDFCGPRPFIVAFFWRFVVIFVGDDEGRFDVLMF